MKAFTSPEIQKTPDAAVLRTGGCRAAEWSKTTDVMQQSIFPRTIEANRQRLNAVSNEAKRNMALAFRRYMDASNAGDHDEAADAKSRFYKYAAYVGSNKSFQRRAL